MRICFLSSMHPPTDKRVFEKEARTLAKYGYEVIHLAPGDGNEWVQNGIRIVTYPHPKGLRSRVSQMRFLYRRARELDADVYHCNEVDSWMVGAALWFLAGRRFVFDVHEHYPEEFSEYYCPKWARPFARVMIAMLINVLSRITSGVVLAKCSLEPGFSHLSKDRVYLVENFVSLASLASLPRRDSCEPPLKLIHLGLIGRTRGWPQLLEALAIARCQDVQLVILGTISDGSEKEFYAEIDRLGLTSRVHYETWLPYEEAMVRVRSSDVGVIMFQPGIFNHVHALPHKMFDFMAAELAIIAPAFALEVAEIVRDARCGLLVDPSKPSSIAEAIDRLCDNPEQLRAFGHCGRAAVLGRYNWEAESEKLLAMYSMLEREIIQASCAG